MYKLITYSDELYHYGVKGMHWGVRRYQNYDGTRIGTGGAPVIKKGQAIRSASRKSVAGGLGGAAKGNARLAATAGGDSNNSKAKSLLDKATTKSIKQGKGKEDISPAEKVSKDFRSGTESAKQATDLISKYDPKVKKAGDRAEQEAKGMSDRELREKINRIKMEKEYRSLAESDVESGWQKAGEVLELVGDVASITLAVLGIIATVKGLKHTDTSVEQEELKRLLDLGGYDDEFIAHAMALDEEYVEDYLEHHGVLGMKWGVRRYQNYDGTRIGTGSGTGGGGGGSNKASNPFRNTVAGGQGGKAKGTARLAAKPISFGSGKKSPSDAMRRDIESINFSSKVRKARDQQHKEMGLPNDATTVSTGKNYDRVLDKMSKESQPWDDKFGSRLEKFSNDIDNYNLRILRGEHDKEEYNRLKTEEADIMSSYKKHTEELLTKYNDEFNAATLKDLGYDEEHVSAGVEYCRRNKKKLYDVYTIF